MPASHWVPRWFIRLAVIYLFIGVCLGSYMGATHNFVLMPVHAHVNLLGWASLALAGLIYAHYPAAAASRLGLAHFWLANTMLPIMMIALTAYRMGHTAAEPVLGLTSIVMSLAMLLFAINVFRNDAQA